MPHIFHCFKRFLYFQILLASTCLVYIVLFNKFFEKFHGSEERRQVHLFDNSCKFVWTEPLDSTLRKWAKYPGRPRCERFNVELFKRYSATGEFSLITEQFINSTKCQVQEIGGALRPNSQTYYNLRNETFLPKFGELFWINADNFIISCFHENLLIFQKPYMGFKLIPPGPLYIPGPIVKLRKKTEKYSVSILVFDSTSRAQFQRHMKKTSELMKNMGSVIFEAYNKVGDNSAVNMLPILADELYETSSLKTFDTDGDINLYKILPNNIRLNPDNLKWIWKSLDAEYTTMLNDDIMHTYRGLFHYPPNNFDRGFGAKPTSFYYRPFYLYLYNYLNNYWRKCLDGSVLAEEFIDSWFRFERIFGNRPHFSLSFIASLTHDDPNNLNILDIILHERLQYLNKTKRLENTFLIIMGDHGNRVHPINRYTFAGKIEERAPLLSIIPPKSWRTKNPEKYDALMSNSKMFISNYDLRETLLDVLNIETPKKRGKSLFTLQNRHKTCQSNNVISNHCLCMVNGTGDLEGSPPDSSRYESVLRRYLESHNLGNCFNLDEIECIGNADYFMPNDYVQVWARTKISDNEVKRLKKGKKSAVIYSYLDCTISSSLVLETQFRIHQASANIKVVYPPKVHVPKTQFWNHCSFYTYPKDYCKCISAR